MIRMTNTDLVLNQETSLDSFYVRNRNIYKSEGYPNHGGKVVISSFHTIGRIQYPTIPETAKENDTMMLRGCRVSHC